MTTQLTQIPAFLMLRKLRLLNTFWALVLAGLDLSISEPWQDGIEPKQFVRLTAADYESFVGDLQDAAPGPAAIMMSPFSSAC